MTSPDAYVDLPVEQPYIQDAPKSSAGQLFGVRQGASSAQAEAFALIRGEVDAIYHYGATGPQLQEFLGATVVADIAHHADRHVAINNGTPNVLTVSGELVRSRPDLVARYVAQVLRASRWARTHRREADAIFAREVSVAEDWMAEAFDARGTTPWSRACSLNLWKRCAYGRTSCCGMASSATTSRLTIGSTLHHWLPPTRCLRGDATVRAAV